MCEQIVKSVYMQKKLLLKKTCRVCKSKNLITVLSLGNIRLSMFSRGNRKPSAYPLTILLCKDCMLVQLKHTTQPELLYTDNYGYRSGINQTMQKELQEIVEKSIAKYGKPAKKLVCIDIGANDGTLLKCYPKQYKRIAIEPVKKLAKEAKKHADIVVNDFFSFKSYHKKLNDQKANIITAISCFYDIDEPNTFLDDITKILDPKGIFIIQQNYLAKMLEENAFDNIVHEHLEYYSFHSLENLLERHNLEIFDVELSEINGGSFRTYISFKGKKKISRSVQNIKDYEKVMKLDKVMTYKNFAKNIITNKKKLLTILNKSIKEGKTIYIYGASTRGNTLLQYYAITKKITPYAVERNKEKWGTKIASVGIPIISEDQARKDKPDFMLVLPWFFKEEFLQREKKYLESGGHFIFPLPQIEVI